MTDVTTELAKLTASTTELTNTVLGKYAALDSKVAAAGDSASGAATSEANAAQSVVDAQKVVDTASSDLSAITAADRVATAASVTAAGAHVTSAQQAKAGAEAARVGAETAEANAAAVVTGGTATTLSEAGKIPLANSEGKIDNAWISGAAKCTKYDFEARRAQNNELFAASGFVHFGNDYGEGTREGTRDRVNLGLWTHTDPNDGYTKPNVLQLGNMYTPKGGSKTDYPVLNIAGVTTKLISNLTPTRVWQSACTVKLPESPNGTVTYDSATGKVFDYSKEVDPKYGDIAADTNEAVARAFEGIVQNGDFRLGDEVGWRSNSLNRGEVTIENNNLRILNTVSGPITTQAASAYVFGGFEDNTTYTVEIDILSFSDPSGSGFLSINLGNTTVGSNIYLKGLTVGTHTLKVTSGGTAAWAYLYLRGIDSEITVSSVSIRKATNEVVTDRVDMWGFEAYLREVSESDPFVYANGLIQSTANYINGVPAVDDDVRPDTYFAWYNGDATSRGKGVNWQTASEANRIKIASDPANNIYFDDETGKFYQWCIRGRSFAGAGNGDWQLVDSTSSKNTGLTFQWGAGLESNVQCQGIRNSIPEALTYDHLYATTANTKGNSYIGVFTASNGAWVQDNSSGINGECYFLVCGTVNRLNQGFYHPSFNISGSMADANGNIWSNSELGFINKEECFDTTKISTTVSGRADGRLSQYVYSSGQGGVCDYRMSAWDASSPAKASEVFERVKNGTYRGREKLIETTIIQGLISPNVATSGWYISNYASRLREKDTGVLLKFYKSGGRDLKIYDSINDIVVDVKLVVRSPQMGGYSYYTITRSSTPSGWASYDADVDHTGLFLILPTTTDIIVEGEFTQMDVIGNPASILQVDALKDGWLGSWIPDFTSRDVRLSRKVVNNPSTWLKTSDFGASWDSVSFDVDKSNIIEAHMDTSPDNVAIVNYTAFAKITKPTDSQAILNGEAGLGNVFNTQSSAHAFIGDSLLGKTLSNSSGWSQFNTLNLTQYLINSYGKLVNTTGATRTSHGDIKMAAPTREPYAVKVLPHQVEVKNQANLNLIYNEVIWNGTDWGDDGSVKIEDKDTTYTNDNGYTCLCGTHQLVIPYGWIKNNK